MLKVIGGVPDGEYKAIASGTLPNGKPVVVNSDGTVSVVSETSGTENLGSETQFPTTSNNSALGISATYDSANGKVVISYRDTGNSYYGTAVVGTVSGSSITWGTPVVYNSTSMSNYTAAAYDTVNEKVVIAYRDANTYGYAIVGTVSGSSISFGTATAFVSTDGANYIDMAYDVSAGAMVINFNHQNSNGGKVIAGTVSGTSISFGSAVQFSSTTGIYGRSVYHPEEQCTIIAWRDSSPIQGEAIALTVSGTTITLGTAVAYQAGGQANQNDIAYDSDSKKIVIIARDEVNTAYGSSYVGTVSGTTLTFASPVTFQSGDVDWMTIQGWYTGGVVAVYDQNQTQLLKYGTISGTTITWSSALTVSSSGKMSDPIGMTMDSGNSRMVLVYNPSGSASSAKYRVYNPDYTATNLTAENYIGMSPGEVEVGSASLGSVTTFSAGNSPRESAVFDSNSNKVVIAYRDVANSSYATVVVATVSGETISFGSPVVYNSSSVADAGMAFDSDTNQIIIATYDTLNSNAGTAWVGSVSGTSITFGTKVVYNVGNATVSNKVVYDTANQKVVIAYKDQAQSNYGKAIVGTVSGSSISFGTEVTFNANTTDELAMTYDSTNGKVVLVYQDTGGNSGAGTTIIGTVSGTSISFGTPVVHSAINSPDNAVTFDSVNGKVVVGYEIAGTGVYAKVGTVSGTSITYGSAVQFGNSTDWRWASAVFDANAESVVFAYGDPSNSNNGKIISGAVSGSTITFQPEQTFLSATLNYTGAAYDSLNEKVVVAFQDRTDNYGKAIVSTTGYEKRFPVADGNNAKVNIIGSVSTNQSGLTAGEKYYVQTDGTISTTADDPSVLAGTAISATKLVVKT